MNLFYGFLSETFNIGRSVKHGDAWSCVLFNLCIDTLLRKVDQSNLIYSIQINDIYIPKAVAYADDVAILTQANCLQDILNIYQEFSLSSGLY